VPAARDELNRYPDKAISVVTRMEVMVGAPLLVTRDIKGFPADDPGVRIPYRV
jgi:hypothetical protein